MTAPRGQGGIRHRAAAALLLLAGAVAVLPALAQRPPAPATVAQESAPRWSALTPGQRAALAPLQAEWPRIDANGKQKWLDLAARMPAMNPDERQRIQVRMAEWARMTPAERGRARLQFQETRQLPPTERQERWQAYQALPPAQREALAAKAAKPAAPTPRPGGAARPGDERPPVEAKKNTVPFLPSTVPPKAVGPTVVQSRPGATTQLVNKAPEIPAHHQAGMPKITASKGFVDPATLLPKRGPQGAAIVAPVPPQRPASAAP